MNLQEKEVNSRKSVQLLYLIAAGIMPFFAVLVGSLFPAVGYYLVDKYMVVPGLLFFGSALTQKLTASAKRSLLLSFVAVFWFVVIQQQHHLADMGNRNIGIFALVYLLAFPFAAVTEDGKDNAGLNRIGSIYLAFSTLMVFFAMLLQLDALPAALQSSIYWDGARIWMFWHPNGSAFVLLLGLGFSLYFAMQAENKWKKGLLAGLAVLHFCTMTLTNGRTTIFLACALTAGTVFFLIWKGGWKRFAAGAAAAIAVAAVMLFAYSTLFDFHKQYQIDKVLKQQELLAAQQAQAEADAAPSAETASSVQSSNIQSVTIDATTGEAHIGGSSDTGQGELSGDIRHLNGRVWIWQGALAALKENPQVRLWGTEFVTAEINFRSSLQTINAHNSWVQTAMLMGLPGLLIALVFTGIAVWNLWVLMWRPWEDVSKKIIAMLVICILMASVLENYLFTGEDMSNCQNFAFFLLTGYLVQWNRLASGKA